MANLKALGPAEADPFAAVYACCGEAAECVVAAIERLSTTEDHLAFLMLHGDYIRSYVRAIALARESGQAVVAPDPAALAR